MTAPHILIVEDDLDIARLLNLDLQDAGYRVSHARSVMSGLTRLREEAPDLMLLDLGLPDGNGRDVLTRIRRCNALPIIILSAQEDYRLKVKLLDLGANDYVVKPYQAEELIVRISVHLRRAASGTMKFGPLDMNVGHRVVRYQGKEIALSPTEFMLIQVLLQQPGQVYSGKRIFEMVWGEHCPFNRQLLNAHMGNIRIKLRAAGGQKLIRSVRNVGYALDVPKLQGRAAS